jgi:WD40 repeat protein
MRRVSALAVVGGFLIGLSLGCGPSKPPEATVGTGPVPGQPEDPPKQPPSTDVSAAKAKAPAAPPKFQELLTLQALTDDDKEQYKAEIGRVFPSVINRLAMSPDGRLLAAHLSVGDHVNSPYAKLWEIPAGKRHALWKLYKGSGRPEGGSSQYFRPSLAFSLDSKRLYAAGCAGERGGNNNSLHVWDIPAGKLLTDELSGCEAICHPDGKRLMVLTTNAGDARVAASDVATGKPESVTLGISPAYVVFHGRGIKLGKSDSDTVREPVQSFDVSPEGDRFAFNGLSAAFHGLHVCSSKPEYISRCLSRENDDLGLPVRAVFTPDSKRVVGFSHPTYGPLETDKPDVIRVWDVSDGKVLTTAKVPHTIRDIAVSHDGHWVAAACEDGAVRLFGTATGSEALVLKGHKGAVKNVLFSRDGKLLVSGGEDGNVRVWKVE